MTNGVVATTLNGGAIATGPAPAIGVRGVLDFFLLRNYAPAVGSGALGKVHPFTLRETNASASKIRTALFGVLPTSTSAEAQVTTLGGGSTAISANVGVQVNQTAAAYAADPWFFDGGTITDIDATLFPGLTLFSEKDQIGFSQGALELFLETTVPGLENAWTLSIGVNKALDDEKDLDIEFVSAPALGIDDAKVIDDLGELFDFSLGSGFVLTEPYILPTVRLSDDEDFAATFGGQAFGEAVVVPLPASGLMFLLACAGALALAQRPRRAGAAA